MSEVMRIAEAGVYALPVIAVLALYVLWCGVAVFFRMNRSMVGSGEFMTRLRDYVAEGDLDNARGLCKRPGRLYADVVGEGVMHIGDPISHVASAMEKETLVRIGAFRRRFAAFPMIAAFCALVGLLGGGLGAISGFYSGEAADGIGSVAVMAERLCNSFVTVTVGAGVAMIILLFYVCLSRKKGKIEKKIQTISDSLIEMLNAPA